MFCPNGGKPNAGRLTKHQVVVRRADAARPIIAAADRNRLRRQSVICPTSSAFTRPSQDGGGLTLDNNPPVAVDANERCRVVGFTKYGIAHPSCVSELVYELLHHFDCETTVGEMHTKWQAAAGSGGATAATKAFAGADRGAVSLAEFTAALGRALQVLTEDHWLLAVSNVPVPENTPVAATLSAAK
eukprot:SAG22_NODE_477_length_9978_cov_2.807268_11_plen_187_part_00